MHQSRFYRDCLQSFFQPLLAWDHFREKERKLGDTPEEAEGPQLRGQSRRSSPGSRGNVHCLSARCKNGSAVVRFQPTTRTLQSSKHREPPIEELWGMVAEARNQSFLCGSALFLYHVESRKTHFPLFFICSYIPTSFPSLHPSEPPQTPLSSRSTPPWFPSRKEQAP